MLRTIGVVLVVLGPSVMGISKALSLKAHARFLSDFVAALELMRAEICTRLTPIPELTEYLAKSAPHGCRAFFAGLEKRMGLLGEMSFSQLWEREADTLTEPQLSGEERSAVRALGMSLGRYDVREQQAAIDMSIARLSLLAEEARKQSGIQGRLWTGLGVTGGLMLAIIMI